MTFIKDIARSLIDNHASFDNVTVVFPNRRAGLFLIQALGQIVDKPTRLPQILSMQDFVYRHSKLEQIETLEAVFQLFEVYKKHRPTEESFDQFFFWGEMIIRDFEEIDQYLVNPQQLFTSIKSQKELDEEFYFLSDEERETILKFWSTFLPEATRTQEAFLQTWKILLPVYEAFKSHLLDQKQAYGGLIYREVAEQIAETVLDEKEEVYFAGYNALTFAEEKIIKYYVREANAKIFWDIDNYYFRDKKQEAGFFLREYANDSVLGKTFPKEVPNRFKSEKNFQKTGVSLEVGQVKSLAESLAELAKDPTFQADKTVIVLPKEHMLLPVLHSLPDEIDKINITMGYPLKDTPVFSLLESVLLLQYYRTDELKGAKYYYKPIVELLNHPLLFSLEDERIKSLIKSIKKGNLIRLDENDLTFEHPLLKIIFAKRDQAFHYLKSILHGLHDTWKDKGHDLELEFIENFYGHITKLEEMMGARANELSYDFLIKLFRRLARSLKVPFTGEPLQGLQIMGILETRNLDFDHVFVLNMNEDSWPAAAKKGSFIPYNIRKAFDLPVNDHQDAIYSYLFYRLLQRAQNVHFYHNTVSEFNVNGEVSRLVKQLEFESGYKIPHRILSNPIQTTPAEEIRVEKTPIILQRLSRYLVGYTGKDQSRITPSALSTYLDCSLKFYFKYVEKLYEPDEVQEEMDPMLFGNILHNSMETLYKNFLGKETSKIVQPQDIFWIREGIETVINKEFIKHYGIKNVKKFKLEGRSIIAADILKKFINKILDYDEAYAPFKIIGLEAGTKEGYTIDFPINIDETRQSVRLKGIIDRLDIKEGTVRVIDYKTGRDSKSFGDIDALFSKENRDAKAIFQVFFYAYLFESNSPIEYNVLEPAIFNSKDLFDKKFDWRVLLKEKKSPVVAIKEWRRYKEDFVDRLSELLHEVFDPEISFEQTEDVKRCSYCTYKEICNRL
ncbi:MAG: PD-(D/E)XK nuclease family protein [Cyclobacteriaceae bacterium]